MSQEYTQDEEIYSNCKRTLIIADDFVGSLLRRFRGEERTNFNICIRIIHSTCHSLLSEAASAAESSRESLLIYCYVFDIIIHSFLSLVLTAISSIAISQSTFDPREPQVQDKYTTADGAIENILHHQSSCHCDEPAPTLRSSHITLLRHQENHITINHTHSAFAW